MALFGAVGADNFLAPVSPLLKQLPQSAPLALCEIGRQPSDLSSFVPPPSLLCFEAKSPPCQISRGVAHSLARSPPKWPYHVRYGRQGFSGGRGNGTRNIPPGIAAACNPVLHKCLRNRSFVLTGYQRQEGEFHSEFCNNLHYVLSPNNPSRHKTYLLCCVLFLFLLWLCAARGAAIVQQVI